MKKILIFISLVVMPVYANEKQLLPQFHPEEGRTWILWEQQTANSTPSDWEALSGFYSKGECTDNINLSYEINKKSPDFSLRRTATSHGFSYTGGSTNFIIEYRCLPDTIPYPTKK